MLGTLRHLASWRYVFIAAGLILLMALIYFFGPFVSIAGVAPLTSQSVKLATVMLIPLGYMAMETARWTFQARLNTKVTQVIAGSPDRLQKTSRNTSDAKDDGGAQEVQTLGLRFKEALTVLKRRRFATPWGGRWLYQLPWYVIIGPPGSGKTTAIANSGLSFPLMDKLGRNAVGGVGGTRNCDWWFTDDAVIIDTAGRYTTQDSSAAQDSTAWLGFLRLLKRYRRSQPLNGVLVAIGISDLTAASDDVRTAHAVRIRQRIGELYKELGVRLPVYVLFTKADLIAGFTEFFDDLGRDGREAVWGLTFDLETPEPVDGYVTRYEAQFDSLVGRLDERLLERIQQEGDAQRRALVFGFPQQVASLRELTSHFLNEAFKANSFDEPMMLRGVYFVSGTQIGTPLDRVMDSMSRTFGLPAPPRTALAGNKRSYFLTRLIREVILGEAGLVDADPRAARRLRRLRYGFYLATVLLTLLAAYFGLSSYFANRALAERVSAGVAEYETAAAAQQLDRVVDDNLQPIVPLLDRLRAIHEDAASPAQGAVSIPGIDQSSKLRTQTNLAYRRGLDSLLLPRLVLHLEGELKSHQQDQQFLYQALKAYLMLGHQGPLDQEFLKRWMSLDLAAAYPGDNNDALRRALDAHVGALLAAPFGNIGLDGDLVARSREVLRKAPLAQSVLAAIVASPEAQAIPPWRLDAHAGPGASTVLQRRSGAPLGDGIAGIFTRDGFFKVFLPHLPDAAKAELAEGWVLDGKQAAAPEPATLTQLQHDTTVLYLQEMGLQWDRLLSDVAIKPVADLDDALRILNTLSAPTSPVRLLVTAAASDTDLAKPPPPAAAGGGPAAAGSPTVQQASAGTDLESLFATPEKDEPVLSLAGRYGQEHFAALRQLVEVPPNSQPGASPPIDRVIGDLGTLYRSLNQLQSDPQRDADQRSAAVSQIEAGAANLPSPIKDWILGISNKSSSLSQEDLRQQISSIWNKDAGSLCRTATDNRFPFYRNAVAEIPLGDFGRLFGVGGAIDSFFTTQLGRQVDTSEKTWKWRGPRSGAAAPSPGALAQFQRAAAIRDSMFAQGGTRPSIEFRLSVVAVDPSSDEVTFDFGGERFEWHRGAGGSLRVRWPATNDSDRTSITFSGSSTATLVEEGTWALFRLLDRGEMQATGTPDRMLARFTAGEHSVTVLLQADSVINPLDNDLLTQFRCPQGL